jgi:branched-subunit amino acid aminotransferase/4-amino-4-deoxychorismate lyase
MSAEVCELTVDDLASADEVWLSNAVIGVRRVGAVGDQRWPEWPRFESLLDLGIPAPGW